MDVRVADLTNATLKDYQEMSAAINFYMRFNGKDCRGGDGWCGLSDLGVFAPEGSFAAKLLLWPAYLGMRLSYGFWLLGPRLFGYRMRFVIDGGVPSTRLVKVRGIVEPKAEAAPAPKASVKPSGAATKKRR